MKSLKVIPDFKSEDEEREFWSTHSTIDYIDVSKVFKARLPNLKHTTKAISIRLTESTLSKLKTKANKMDVPYQSLIKIFIEDGINRDKPSHSKRKPSKRPKKILTK